VSALSPPPHWTLYVDGSCLGNQNVDADTPASWGLVVVTGDSGLGKGSGELHHEIAGPVITSSGDDGFIGAQVGSNNTAELSGFAAALRWLLVEGGDDEAMIRADSTLPGTSPVEFGRPRPTESWSPMFRNYRRKLKRSVPLHGPMSKPTEAIDGTSGPTTSHLGMHRESLPNP